MARFSVLLVGSLAHGKFSGPCCFEEADIRIFAHRNKAASILCVLQFELQIHDSPLFDGMTVAAIIGGLSVNLVAYPAMVLECMFPDNAALAVTYSEYIDALYFIPLAVCLQGLCSLVPPLLMKIWRGLPDLTFESYWRSLMMFAAIPLCVVYVLALPKSRDEEEPKEKTEKRPLVKQVEELLEAMATPEYVCVVVLTGILMLMGVWYQSDMASLVGPTIARDMGWWMWTDAFLGLAQGKLCDSVGTPIMILLQLVCYGLIFLASLSGEHAGQYGTVFLWIATMSYTYGIKYTFAQEFLAPHLRGTLIGVAGVTSGLFLSLLRVISRTGSPEYWCIIFTMVCGSLTPAAMYLWYRKVQLKQKID
ncbi:putative transmembrane protein [Gregarina niphandrodes]|uniref:Transmembrane protein n=1 Tax=Gregarina niphandrodes TaxID=110365 RepID=A0A023B7M1_GRENI|nr:putative transmembrane protein [Gregarina niphandrodes]EZG67512.1 putative transmembrane protein [Gregarina niphandrodes]|eukprot:XP_011130227.1 putative transmembrane protein [Gregarina niphandrodes]